MLNEVIKLDHISKEYITESGKQMVLNNIDLVVFKGEFVGVIGDSGCGKTTLMNLIGGLDIPTNGKIRIMENQIENLTEQQLTDFRRNHIGFIFQNYNLIGELTVFENIIFSCHLKEKSVNKELVVTLMKMLKLWDKKDEFPEKLSGGEKQRTAILRSVISSPDIILADEPTGNLDSKNTQIVMLLLKYINEKLGCTILMVTHNEKLTKDCDRIIMVEDGSLKECKKIF